MRKEYLSKAEASRMLRECQERGTLTEEFVEALTVLVKGVCKKFEPPRTVTPDEIVSEVIIIIERVLPNIRTNDNVFAYLTTLAVNNVRCHWRKFNQDAKLIAELNFLNSPDRRRRMRPTNRPPGQD